MPGMPTPPQHREAIVAAAARLFRRQGYAATGLNQVVAESRAPKGSLYHYFPEGKAQIAAEVIRYAADKVTTTLGELARSEPSAADLLRAYARLLTGWLEESDFRDGSPIATALLELTPGDARVAAAGRAALDDWAGVLESRLRSDGVDDDRASRLARMALAALDGALVQARVAGDGRPVLDAAEEVALLIDLSGPRLRR